MKARVFSAITILLLGFGSVASANPYGGVSVGKVDYDLPYFDKATGFEFYMGTKISPNAAIEVSYVDFGESDDGIPPVWTISGNSLGGSMKLMAPLSRGLDIYARLGIHMWDLELEEDGFGVIAEDDGTDLMYGFGALLKLASNIGAGFKYTIYDLDEEDASMLALDFQVQF
jgi:hypothetical protein